MNFELIFKSYGFILLVLSFFLLWLMNFVSKSNIDIKNQVLKGIEKVSQNPLPVTEGGYGKPLGNKNGTNLSGFLKIKFLNIGIRVVYYLMRSEENMEIIVVSARADEAVYKEAEKRKQKYF